MQALQGSCIRGQAAFRGQRRSVRIIAAATAVGGRTSKKQLVFPFVKIQGQDEMKMALLLNVVDPNIGGVLVMGDRGTAKSVAVRGLNPSHEQRACGGPVFELSTHG